MNEWKNAWTNECMNGRMDGWMKWNEMKWNEMQWTEWMNTESLKIIKNAHRIELYWNVLKCNEMYWNVLKCTEMYWNVLKCTELRNKSPLQLICGRKYESMYCVCWLLVCVLCAATGNIQECFVSHWIDLLQMHQSSSPTQSSVIFGPIKLCPFVSEYQTLNKRSLIF